MKCVECGLDLVHDNIYPGGLCDACFEDASHVRLSSQFEEYKHRTSKIQYRCAVCGTAVDIAKPCPLCDSTVYADAWVFQKCQICRNMYIPQLHRVCPLCYHNEHVAALLSQTFPWQNDNTKKIARSLLIKVLSEINKDGWFR